MSKKLEMQDFFRRFPDDEACLEYLMLRQHGNKQSCPKCEKNGRFAKIRKIPAYSCPWCGHHIHPMKGTPFERSRTPLRKWFYAFYLFQSSDRAVTVKELGRRIDVTYKTAWRIAREIRKNVRGGNNDAFFIESLADTFNS